jgi:hypothetical protein
MFALDLFVSFQNRVSWRDRTTLKYKRNEEPQKGASSGLCRNVKGLQWQDCLKTCFSDESNKPHFRYIADFTSFSQYVSHASVQ